ncbi:hypothetical protein QJS10_CPA10g01428 [Acorus calamus]|uniref:Uncharacterized protein n=1 Tax=Acorus calamus TaxID=4465 RepID=A0AAV9E056_ACOCL|nr:hypothetical protein QJS10_CPA10g01428 [Acorus calamus]
MEVEEIFVKGLARPKAPLQRQGLTSACDNTSSVPYSWKSGKLKLRGSMISKSDRYIGIPLTSVSALESE